VKLINILNQTNVHSQTIYYYYDRQEIQSVICC